MEPLVARRRMDVSTDEAWAVVSDVVGYAEHAPSLSRAEVVEGAGEGMVRRCYDGRGRGWSETCTLWEAGRSYRMQVDTSTYPFPLRQLIREFEGTWSVTPDGGGARVEMRFDAQPRLGPVGRLALRAIRRRGMRECEATLDGFERAMAERRRVAA